MGKKAVTDKPLQRISYKKKIQKGEGGYSKWGGENIDFYINRGNFDNDNDYRKQEMFDNYNYYNNKIPEEKFHYVKNPLNSNRENHQHFPARIRPYNIIRPNVDLYMGEFIQRLFPYTVLNLNTEAYDKFEEEKKKALYANMYQSYINHLNELGIDTGEDSQEVQLPEEIEDKFRLKYSDIKATKGQQKLRKIEREKDLFVEFKRLFKDYVIAGECISRKGVYNGDLEFERISPLAFRYGMSPNKVFIEDSEWQVYKEILTPSEVVDKFYDKLTEEQHKYLEETTAYDTFSREDFYNRVLGQQDKDNTGLVYVYHVCWKSLRKAGKYNYIDELGQTNSIEVDENFKLSDEDKEIGNTVDWFWVNEVWEGFRLGKDFYLGIQPLLGQRNAVNNFSKCKMPYNGIRFSDTHAVNVSPVSLGIPYQIMYIIIEYYIEKTIAKNKGKIALIDKNVIPTHEGWDEETFFYYSEATGWGIIDRNQIGVDKSFNQYTVLDMSTLNEVAQLIPIKEAIRNDYDELLGITRQRKGQSQASDTVGGTQSATFQSSLISELLFSNFDDFRRSDYQGIMDLCKFTTINGERGVFMNDDMQQEMYNIEPGEFADIELGVYVSNNPTDLKNLANYKQFAQAFAQNGQSPSTVLEIIRSENILNLKEKLSKIEEMQMQQVEKNAANEREAEAQKVELEKEFEAFKAELESKHTELENDRLDNREIIKGEIDLRKEGLMASSSAEDTIDDIERRGIEREKLYSDERRDNTTKDLKEKELSLKEKEMMTRAESEKYKADISLKIAKENKNKYDK